MTCEFTIIEGTRALWFDRMFFNNIMTFTGFHIDDRLPQNDMDMFVDKLHRAKTNHDCDADLENIRLSNMIDGMQAILTLWGDVS